VENAPDSMGNGYHDSMGNVGPRYGFFHGAVLGDETADNGGFGFDPLTLFDNDIDTSLTPYDL